MILTGQQIIDIARLAGFDVEDTLDEDHLEIEIAIVEDNGKIYAYYYEYPDEGVVQLTDQ